MGNPFGIVALSFLAYVCTVTCVNTTWPDCSPASVNTTGVFGEMQQFNATANDGTVVFVLHPPLPGHAPYPVMVFSHGSSAEYAMYESAFKRYVSHGFVVIFPHIKGPKEDTKSTTVDPMGHFTMKGVDFATKANSDESSPLHAMLDLANLVLAGHSMGASATIMTARHLPAGAAKVAVAQHPGICGPFGPPPCLGPGPLCNTWMPKDFENVSAKMPILLTTATNDAAFWPAPHTAQHELGCFHKSTDHSASKASTAFAQFSADVCQDDGQGGRYDRKWSDGGHACPLKKDSVETPWVLVAAKLYAQLGGSSTSQCHAMLWGANAGSLQKDPAAEQVVVNPPDSSTEHIVV